MKNFTDEKTLLREIKNGNGEASNFCSIAIILGCGDMLLVL